MTDNTNSRKNTTNNKCTPAALAAASRPTPTATAITSPSAYNHKTETDAITTPIPEEHRTKSTMIDNTNSTKSPMTKKSKIAVAALAAAAKPTPKVAPKKTFQVASHLKSTSQAAARKKQQQH